MEIEFIRAGESDKLYLLELRKCTMSVHLDRAHIDLSDSEHADCVAEDFKHAYLIVHQDQRIGLLKWREGDQVLGIMQFQIHPDFQGRGLGQQVLDKIIHQSKLRKKPIRLNVLKGNPALSLYLRNGFYRIGEDPHEYHLMRPFQLVKRWRLKFLK